MKKLIYFLALLPFTIFSCQQEPDPEPNEPNPGSTGSMTCTLDGNSFTATSFNNTLIRITSGNPTGKRLDLRGTDANGLQLILSCAITSSNTGEDMPITTYTTGSTEYEALITLIQNNQTLGMATSSEDDHGTIVITSLDASAHTCSGTFEFDAMKFNGDTTMYNGVNGQFSGLVYSVQ